MFIVEDNSWQEGSGSKQLPDVVFGQFCSASSNSTFLKESANQKLSRTVLQGCYKDVLMIGIDVLKFN